MHDQWDQMAFFFRQRQRISLVEPRITVIQVMILGWFMKHRRSGLAKIGRVPSGSTITLLGTTYKHTWGVHGR